MLQEGINMAAWWFVQLSIVVAVNVIQLASSQEPACDVCAALTDQGAALSRIETAVLQQQNEGTDASIVPVSLETRGLNNSQNFLACYEFS